MGNDGGDDGQPNGGKQCHDADNGDFRAFVAADVSAVGRGVADVEVVAQVQPLAEQAAEGCGFCVIRAVGHHEVTFFTGRGVGQRYDAAAFGQPQAEMAVELQCFADFVVVVALQAGVGQIEADEILRPEGIHVFRPEVSGVGNQVRDAVRHFAVEPK